MEPRVLRPRGCNAMDPGGFSPPVMSPGVGLGSDPDDQARMRRQPPSGFVWLCAWLVGLSAPLQGGGPVTVRGRVTDPTGLAVANAVVTATAVDRTLPPAAVPAAGVSARSDSSGTYILMLPSPGEYRVAFDLEGFERLARIVTADTATVTLDVRLELAAIPQTIRVTQAAENDPERESKPGEVVFPADALDRVPVGRSPERAADMAPGVSARGPNNALVMAGAFSYGNLFLVDGLPANENTRGQSRPFFIQDAVLETRVSTGSVPAEYGRFQGGVIQTITRSGGNTVSGSLRVTITNDNWRALTPYRGDQTLNRRVPTWEAVIGGPAVRHRLYYFGAALGSRLEQGRTLAYTRGNYTYADRELKYQLKGTWTPAKSHTLRAGYFGVDSKRTNASAGPVMDAASLYDSESPESLAGASYAAVIHPRLLAEARYSRRALTYSGSGARDVSLEGGTPIWDRSRSDARFNSPQGCAACPGSEDERRNQDAGASVWLSLPSTRAGAHELIAGVDAIQDTRRTNAYQSGSSYRVRATRAIIAGDSIYPVLLPDRTTWIYWQPVAQQAAGNDLRTYSAFVSDTWRPAGRLTIKAGLRYDVHDAIDSAGAPAVHDSTWSPRLAAAWDPAGGGAWLVSGGWSRYVSSINSNVADAASAAGRPATYVYDYLGPAINGGAAALTPPHDALRQLFTWFLAPGATRVPRSAPVIPGVNVRMDPALGPLDAREIAMGASRRLGTRGSFRADGIFRRYRHFYATRRDTATGTVTGPGGTAYDLALITNAGTDATRDYSALLVQANYRPSPRLQLFGSYTLAWTEGNVDGEDAAVGPTMVLTGDYPEYRAAEWNAPSGPLATDQRHKMRLWGTWDLPVPRGAGRLVLGAVQRFETGLAWSAVGNINPRAYVGNPGYRTPPTSVQYFFGPRGEYRTDTLSATDLSLNWSRRIPGARRGQAFVRAVLVNAFNRAAATRVNKTILTRNDSAVYQAFDPFAGTPVPGLHYGLGSDFGEPIGPFDYQAPREFSISLGVRF